MCFDGPARAVADEIWCTAATTTTFWVCLGRYPPWLMRYGVLLLQLRLFGCAWAVIRRG